MAAVRPTCLGELAFDSAADLAKRHPPALQHENKRAAFDLGLPLLSGRPVRYSRWQLEELPSLADPAGTQVRSLAVRARAAAEQGSAPASLTAALPAGAGPAGRL